MSDEKKKGEKTPYTHKSSPQNTLILAFQPTIIDIKGIEK